MSRFQAASRAFFCDQKARFVSLWFFSSLLFFLFALLPNVKEDLGGYVILSIFTPMISYLALIGTMNWRGRSKAPKTKEEIHVVFTDLAKRENPKIREVVTRELPEKGSRAYSVGEEKKVLSRALFNGSYSDEEIKAVLFHEIGHTKIRNYEGFVAVLFFPLLWIGTLSIFVLFPSWTLFVQFPTAGFFSSAFLVLYEKIRWKSEFNADKFASDKVGGEHVISSFMKIAPFINTDCNTPTHPSLNRRLSRLKKGTNRT